jgi:Raf kinase inhibitor-like YbhB/YbcL family protein
VLAAGDGPPRIVPPVKRVVRVLVAVTVATALGACSHDGRTLRPAGPGQTLSIASSSTTVATTEAAHKAGADTQGLTVTAPWPDNGFIDAKYTCKGANVSPPISWSGVPAETKELALSLVDLDASDFVHWVVAGLDPASTGIVEGKLPAGATQATNGFGKAGWNGPCPPDGQHTYLLTLYALPAPSGIKSTTQGSAAINSLDAHKLASVAMTGLFG